MGKNSEIATIDLISVGSDSKNLQKIEESLGRIVEEHLELKSGDLLLIKPNLTLPWYRPGACTSKEVIECLCSVLRDKNCRIGICEGDGGVASYSAYEAFAGNDLLDLSNRFGVKFISLSLLPRRKVSQVIEEKEITFELPTLLIDREFDNFINLPVLKVHVFTLLSLSMKNLWGCIPDPLRIHYHKTLHRGIVALWKTIRPDLSIIDGLVAMDGNGPMNGIPVPLGVIVGGSGDATVDRVGAEILGIPFRKVKHLVIAEKEGLIRPLEQIRLSQPIKSFCKRVFNPERRLSNWGMIAMSQIPAVQKFVYHSGVSKNIYRILRKVRRANVQNDIRHYGDPGWGEGCGRSDFVFTLGSED